MYRKFYKHLLEKVVKGNSFQQSFESYKSSRKLIPLPVQQIIISGENSGRLNETLIRVGAAYEAKTDTSTKNLAVLLEPILLVVVWLGVVSIALAVILPVYNLIGGLNQQTAPKPKPVERHYDAPLEIDEGVELIKPNEQKIEVAPLPSITISQEFDLSPIYAESDIESEEIGQVGALEEYDVLDQEDNWYQIVLPEEETGWVLLGEEDDEE